MTDQAPQDWKNYDDFAAGIDTNRLPQSEDLVGQSLEIELKNGRSFALTFAAKHQVRFTEAGEQSEEWCEVVALSKGDKGDVYHVDVTFKAREQEAETLIFNIKTRRVLSVRCRIREEGEAPGEPRVAQDWVPGRLKGGELSGEEPAPSRDLIGLRAFYTYSPNHVYEHVYMSSERYGWQNLVGIQRGHGDTDLATTFKFDDNQYVFGFREFIIPVASVFFYDWDNMRSTGKFLGVAGDGTIQNNQAGAYITKASMTYYAPGQEPV